MLSAAIAAAVRHRLPPSAAVSAVICRTPPLPYFAFAAAMTAAVNCHHCLQPLLPCQTLGGQILPICRRVLMLGFAYPDSSSRHVMWCLIVTVVVSPNVSSPQWTSRMTVSTHL
jgi:hypothetical protein